MKEKNKLKNSNRNPKRRKLWKVFLSLFLSLSLCIADSGIVLAKEAFRDTEFFQDVVIEEDTEEKRVLESEAVLEGGSVAEAEESSETETPEEVESSSETETSEEVESSSEAETSEEVESSSEAETSEEVESSSETETPEETKPPVIAAPDEPVLKSASAVGSTVTIKWNAVSGAEGYRIYRKTAETSWKKIAEVDADRTSWEDSDLDGGTYIYTVRAFVKDEDSYLLSSYDKNGISVKVLKAPAAPVLKSISSTSYNSVTIQWNKVFNVEGYCVYRKTEGNSWKQVAEVKAGTTKLVDEKLSCGTEYTYTVRAFIKNGKEYLLSSYNKTGLHLKPVPLAPVLKSTTSSASSVRIQWEKVSGVTSYRIYRKVSDGSWKKLASVKSSETSYTDKKADKGTKYIYTVKGMHNSVAGKYNRTGIEGAVLVQSIVMQSVSVSSGGSASIQWKKRTGSNGYYIYRKVADGSWKRIADVSSDKSSWSEKGLDSKSAYCYTVVGYMKLNGKKVKGSVNHTGLAPKLEYSGAYVRNVKKTYLGTSGSGRKMYSYRIGSGKNHIVITMEIHGWEDSWKKDGAVLVKNGEQLIKNMSEKTSVLKKKDYSIIIVPMANPDGLLKGTTNDGPERCTTYRYNSNGKLVKGGVDLNRCFPCGFKAQYNSRNYTGSKPLLAKEAVILKSFIDSSKGAGKNIFIDTHGWYNQIITRHSGSGKLYKAFKKYFPGAGSASFGSGLGYISGYAYSKGYDSVLFEFPYISSEKQFTKNNYAGKYMNTILYMVNNL